MTDQHPITPPPELRCQWQSESPFRVISVEREDYMIDRAAQWGADQELLAVEEEIIAQGWFANSTHRRAQLRAARRPKPPTLKEQALKALTAIHSTFHVYELDANIIRRALEALPND
jgi:hypothetical protein